MIGLATMTDGDLDSVEFVGVVEVVNIEAVVDVNSL
jgi:hypothetical protein